MRSTNTFGVHFIARPNQKGSHTIYARIVVNKSKCELGMKQTIDKDDWNSGRGSAKPKTPALKQLIVTWKRSGQKWSPTTNLYIFS